VVSRLRGPQKILCTLLGFVPTTPIQHLRDMRPAKNAQTATTPAQQPACRMETAPLLELMLVLVPPLADICCASDAWSLCFGYGPSNPSTLSAFRHLTSLSTEILLRGSIAPLLILAYRVHSSVHRHNWNECTHNKCLQFFWVARYDTQ
jgi:hypothetical protein